jgi:hypothetical protein
MAEEPSRETREMVLAEVRGQVRSTNVYSPGEIVVPSWIKTEVA